MVNLFDRVQSGPQQVNSASRGTGSGYSDPLVTSAIELQKELFTPDVPKDNPYAEMISKDLALTNFPTDLHREIALIYLQICATQWNLGLFEAAAYTYSIYCGWINGLKAMLGRERELIATSRHEVQGREEHKELTGEVQQQKKSWFRS